MTEQRKLLELFDFPDYVVATLRGSAHSEAELNFIDPRTNELLFAGYRVKASKAEIHVEPRRLLSVTFHLFTTPEQRAALGIDDAMYVPEELCDHTYPVRVELRIDAVVGVSR